MRPLLEPEGTALLKSYPVPVNATTASRAINQLRSLQRLLTLYRA
jgi:hypothetical protein